MITAHIAMGQCHAGPIRLCLDDFAVADRWVCQRIPTPADPDRGGSWSLGAGAAIHLAGNAKLGLDVQVQGEQTPQGNPKLTAREENARGSGIAIRAKPDPLRVVGIRQVSGVFRALLFWEGNIEINQDYCYLPYPFGFGATAAMAQRLRPDRNWGAGGSSWDRPTLISDARTLEAAQTESNN